MKRNHALTTIVTAFIGASIILSACDTPGAPGATAPTTGPAEQPPAPATASAQPPATSADTQAPTHLILWHQWDSQSLGAISQALKEYEAVHPGVTIELVKPDDIVGALNAAAKSGAGPDMISWSSDQIGEQALRGNIIALNELGITPAILQSTYEPAAARGVTARGKIYALPESQEAIALVYNKDTVSGKYLPKNLADLLDKARAYQKDTAKVLVCNEGFGDPDALRVAPIYFGFGVPAYVDETGKSYAGTPEMLKGGEWLASLAKVSLRKNSRGACNAGLKDGTVGMWWTGPWSVDEIEANGVNYGIVPMGKPFVSLKVMMIGKDARDRKTDKAALDILKYFTSADVQKKLSVANRTIPAATAAIKSSEVAGLSSVSGFAAAAAMGVPMSTSPYARAQWDPVGLASALIWVGAQKPAEALADAEKQLKAAISQMK